jgi:urease accessory protein
MATPHFAERAPQGAGPPRGRLTASLSLSFVRDASGRTALAASLQEPPLRVVRAFAREDGSSLAHLHNVSGGLLGGDRLSLSVDVAAGAQVQLTTTGATRIYRPAAGAAPTEQFNQVRVGENAVLEYVPDVIIPYAYVRFEQRSEIHLGAGAGLFWWDVFAPGREARGEAFAYERLEVRTDVFAADRLIAAERVCLEPALREVGALARLANYPYWVTLYVCRVGIEAPRWLQLEEKLRQVAQESVASGKMLWGISTLPAHGLAVRGLARRGHGISAALHSLWSAAKVALYGREPILPRKLN